MWVATSPPPARVPCPRTIRSSPSISTSTPLTRSMRGGGGQPVGFLDPQFLQAPHHRGAFGERRGDRQHRIFVDHRRARARPARRRRAARRAAYAEIGDHRSPPSLRTSLASIDAPISRSVVNSPVRSGLVITPSSNTSEPGDHQRRDHRKRRRGRIGRHHDGGGAQLRLAGERDAAAWRASSRLDANSRAEMRQHLFGMVAGRLGLDHGGHAGRRQPGQQHRRFDLRRRHRRFDRRSASGRARRRASAAAGRPSAATQRPRARSAQADRGCAASAACAARRRRRTPR